MLFGSSVYFTQWYKRTIVYDHKPFENNIGGGYAGIMQAYGCQGNEFRRKGTLDLYPF